jgi:Ser-tRNA(Ala) deacylase AlaX
MDRACIGDDEEGDYMKRQHDPRMHSAEHLLNQTMVRMFGCGRCFTAHLERKKSKCDYHFDHALTKAQIAQIETRVNAVIMADLPVTESFVARAVAQERYDTGKLPDTVTGDLRIVHMGDYDACPCVGEHVGSTGEIGRFKITTTSFAEGKLRIRFKLSSPGDDGSRQ